MEHTQSIVDITDIFMKFVASIVQIDYYKLQKTNLFHIMQQCVLRNTAFILNIDGTQLIHKDINALFYDTYQYFMSNDRYSDSAILLKMAIDKIETIINENELIECIEYMNINDKSNNDDITDINDMLSLLII